MDLCFVFIKDLDVHLTLLGFAFLNKKLSIYIGVPYKMFYCGMSSVPGSFGMSTSLSRQTTPFFIIIKNNLKL